MNDYELTIILKPQTADKDKEAVLSMVKKVIEAEKGKIEKSEEWGKKVFSYPIKKLKEGIYLWLQFKMEPKQIVKLDKKIKMEEGILRYLLVKKED